MRDNDKKPDSHVAYGAAMDGVSSVLSSVSVIGRYCWNIQMQLLLKIGIMPLFRNHWWLFFVVGFFLLAFLPPLGIVFIVSAFCAGQMDPKAKDDFIVPLRQEDREKEYTANVDSAQAVSNPILKSLAEDEQEDLYVYAGIAHASFLNAIEREVDDAEFSAAAVGAFDGTVQGRGIKLTDIEMFIMGSAFIVRQLKALERLDEVDPERIADLTMEAMESQALNGIREQAGHVAYSLNKAEEIATKNLNLPRLGRETGELAIQQLSLPFMLGIHHRNGRFSPPEGFFEDPFVGGYIMSFINTSRVHQLNDSELSNEDRNRFMQAALEAADPRLIGGDLSKSWVESLRKNQSEKSTAAGADAASAIVLAMMGEIDENHPSPLIASARDLAKAQSGIASELQDFMPQNGGHTDSANTALVFAIHEVTVGQHMRKHYPELCSP